LGYRAEKGLKIYKRSNIFEKKFNIEKGNSYVVQVCSLYCLKLIRGCNFGDIWENWPKPLKSVGRSDI